MFNRGQNPTYLGIINPPSALWVWFIVKALPNTTMTVKIEVHVWYSGRVRD